MITKPATQDLLEIKNYIWRDLSNPIAAENTANGIMKKIDSLRIFPARQPILDDKLDINSGLRRIQYSNYNIFYYYDLEENAVYIIRILYNKVNWYAILDS